MIENYTKITYLTDQISTNSKLHKHSMAEHTGWTSLVRRIQHLKVLTWPFSLIQHSHFRVYTLKITSNESVAHLRKTRDSSTIGDRDTKTEKERQESK